MITQLAIMCLYERFSKLQNQYLQTPNSKFFLHMLTDIQTQNPTLSF